MKKYSIIFSKKSKGKINKIVFKIKAFHYKKPLENNMKKVYLKTF